MSDSRPRSHSAASASIARHGRLRRSNPFVIFAKFVAVAVAVVLVSAVSLGAIAIARLTGNIETVALAGDTPVVPGAVVIPAPQLGSFEGGFNILVVGSDVCDVPGGCKDRQAELNDVTMLIHVFTDQTSAVAVSIPRDMVVPIPACPKKDGNGNYNSMSAQPINNTLTYGGLACTVLTVEKLTGLDIPYAALITFNGVIGMSNAVGGVPVCVNGPINDKFSGLSLPAAGEYTLKGEDALAFLRTRHGVGDGSDLGRISSQQVFLSSLVRTVKSDSTLTNLPKLFGIATAATSNMQLSTRLANLNTMVSMALVLKKIPLDRITFVQYPGTTGVGGVYEGKVAPIKAQADALFARIASDTPFALEARSRIGSEVNPNAPVPTVPPAATAPPTSPASPAPAPPASPAPNASGAPVGGSSPAAPPPAAATPVEPSPSPSVLAGVLGQTAADYTCSKAN